MVLVSSIVILVVILSAIGYGWIAAQESRTGGMGEKLGDAGDSKL